VWPLRWQWKHWSARGVGGGHHAMNRRLDADSAGPRRNPGRLVPWRLLLLLVLAWAQASPAQVSPAQAATPDATAAAVPPGPAVIEAKRWLETADMLTPTEN
jgi:hypothetical protein